MEEADDQVGAVKKTALLIVVGLIACNKEPDPVPTVVEPPVTAKADATPEATDVATPKSMNDARVIPQVEDGAVVGLRFEDVKPDSATSRAGIQSGDIVKTMDRTPMTGAMQGLIFFQRLDTKTPMGLDIVRGGKPVHLEIK